MKKKQSKKQIALLLGLQLLFILSVGFIAFHAVLKISNASDAIPEAIGNIDFDETNILDQQQLPDLSELAVYNEIMNQIVTEMFVYLALSFLVINFFIWFIITKRKKYTEYIKQYAPFAGMQLVAFALLGKGLGLRFYNNLLSQPSEPSVPLMVAGVILLLYAYVGLCVQPKKNMYGQAFKAITKTSWRLLVLYMILAALMIATIQFLVNTIESSFWLPIGSLIVLTILLLAGKIATYKLIEKYK